MSGLEKNDHQPGVPPETRLDAVGAIVLIISIAAELTMSDGAILVLRCEPDGRILAAISRTPIDSSHS